MSAIYRLNHQAISLRKQSRIFQVVLLHEFQQDCFPYKTIIIQITPLSSPDVCVYYDVYLLYSHLRQVLVHYMDNQFHLKYTYITSFYILFKITYIILLNIHILLPGDYIERKINKRICKQNDT